jgi:uncharacterized damage-inducible protein DinB
VNTADYMRTLFDSLYWARDRVLDAAAGMSEEEYSRANGFEYGSLRGILTHTLGAETNYLHRCMGTPAPAPDSPEATNEANVPTLEALGKRWLAEEQRMRGYLDSLDEAELARVVTWTRRDGVQMSQPVWQLLTTVYQHTLQHRSEAAEALTMIGRSPGGLDFPVYLASKG